MIQTSCPVCSWLYHSEVVLILPCVKCGSLVQIGDNPGQTVREVSRHTHEANRELLEQRKERGRAAWRRLHAMTAWTESSLQAWLDSVPSIACDCRRFAREYIAGNPPPFGDLARCRRWSYEFHCAVDQKIGDAPITWEQAVQEWGWDA